MFSKNQVPVNFTDLTGKKFNRWTVTSMEKVNGTVRWRCICECGAVGLVATSGLTKGASKSCGCFRTEAIKKAKRTHGLSESPEYRAWRHIQSRCSNPNVWNYENYGGRGIKVHPSWINGRDGKSGFETFYEDIGPRPSSSHSIDRIQMNGDYEPGNVHWATVYQQASNKRNNVMITFKGETHHLREWSRILNMSYKNLHKRINVRKWSVERAFTEPSDYKLK